MIPDRQEAVNELLWRCFPAKERPGLAPTIGHGRTPSDLIARASRARNGARFDRLFAGKWEGDHASQSEADLALCASLAFWTGKDADQIDSLFRQSGLFRPKWDERHYGDGRTYGQETIAKAIAGCTQTYRSGAQGSPAPREHDDGLPEIRMEGGELTEIVDTAERALLAAAGHEIFQRGGLLVRLTRAHSESARRGLKRSSGSLVIRPIEVPHLVERLTAAAHWMKFNAKTKEWSEIDCPERVAKTFEARGKWTLKSLAGTIEAPTLRPDGSVLATPGYDEVTGLYYDPGDISFPVIKTTPTREDALEALQVFRDLLSGFPFVDQDPDRPGSDFAVAVSAVLTALVRKSIKSAPLHAFRAPKMGSGKSLLADVVGMIASGRPCAVMSLGEDANEERKRWLSVLLEGDPVVCIDNIEKPLRGSTLCSILTQETYKDRILGMSRTVTVSTAVTLLCTGNNLVFDGDLTTRVIPCDLDPGVERPEERSFEVNLYQYAPEHRAELVVAGLTILRAFVVAGRPRQEIPTFGRFEEWSDLVRSALVWLGTADPCAGRSRIEEQDPTRQRLGQLLIAWKEALPGRLTTVAEAIALADIGSEHEPLEHLGNAARLRDALLAVAGDRAGRINPRFLGNYLSKHAKRFEGGLRFEKGPERHKVATWGVAELGSSGVPRDSGVIPYARETDSGSSMGILSRVVRDTPSIPSEPPASCFNCHSTDFWLNGSGDPVCRRCHPPVNEVLS